MKQLYAFLIILFIFSNVEIIMAQELYVGSGAEYYLKKDLPFTTNNTVVSVDALGKF